MHPPIDVCWLHCAVAQDWDSTTTDWFTNKEEDDIALPEYKLVFLWFEKNIAVAVDQVRLSRWLHQYRTDADTCT